ncbi:MAG: hypothetical protein M3Y56_17160 [Armatimonadota bacterium]|nr:hypothetical protein [Armatimonadota bacterium]
MILDSVLLAYTARAASLCEEWRLSPYRMENRRTVFGRTQVRSFRDAVVSVEYSGYVARTTTITERWVKWRLWVRTTGPEKMLLLDSGREDTTALGEFISEHTGWPLRTK